MIWDVLSSSILYESAFRLAVLFVLAATGEWMAERAGTLNISLEGMIIAGAFGAAVGSSTFRQRVDRAGLRRRRPAWCWPRCRPT